MISELLAAALSAWARGPLHWARCRPGHGTEHHRRRARAPSIGDVTNKARATGVIVSSSVPTSQVTKKKKKKKKKKRNRLDSNKGLSYKFQLTLCRLKRAWIILKMFSPYCAVNTLPLCYGNKLINTVYINNHEFDRMHHDVLET